MPSEGNIGSIRKLNEQEWKDLVEQKPTGMDHWVEHFHMEARRYTEEKVADLDGAFAAALGQRDLAALESERRLYEQLQKNSNATQDDLASLQQQIAAIDSRLQRIRRLILGVMVGLVVSGLYLVLRLQPVLLLLAIWALVLIVTFMRAEDD